MNKKTCSRVVALLSVFGSASIASAQSWSWVGQAGGSGDEFGSLGPTVTVDDAGTTMVAGPFEGTLNVGGIELNAIGNGHDVFLARYDQSGRAQWAARLGGDYEDVVFAVAVDQSSDIWVAGRFKNRAWFDDAGYDGAYPVRFDLPAGSSARFGGSTWVPRDPRFRTIDSTGTTFLRSWGGKDGYVAHYRSTGELIDVWAIGGPDTEGVTGIAIDANQDVVVVGAFDNVLTLGQRQLQTGAGDPLDAFVAKIARNGTVIWAEQEGTADMESPEAGVVVDAAGDVYVAGPARCVPVDWDDYGCDAFVAKHDGETGERSWITISERGDIQGASAQGIAVSPDGNIFLAGFFDGSMEIGGLQVESTSGGSSATEIFVARLDGLDGSVDWLEAAGGPGGDWAYSVAADGAGNAIVTGSYGLSDQSALFGDFELLNHGIMETFVAKYGPDGECIWAVRSGDPEPDPYGGASDDGGFAIDTWGDRCVVTGVFSDDYVMGSTTLESAGSYDVFVAALEGCAG